MSGISRSSLLIIFWICSICTTYGQEYLQYIIDDELDYASRDQYSASLSLPNHQKYIYVTYEELSSDMEPGHLILNNENEILYQEKSEDYQIKMPISDIDILWHQGSIYVVGKIVSEAQGNVRLLQVSPSLELINYSTFSLTKGSISGLQLHTINDKEIALSYINLVDNNFVLQRLNNDGTPISQIEKTFTSNIHDYQIDFTAQNFAFATFNLSEGLSILRISDIVTEVFYQANSSEELYAADHMLIEGLNYYIGYSREVDNEGQANRQSRLIQLDDQGGVLWNKEIGDSKSISNSIGGLVFNKDKVCVIGYTYSEDNFDLFFQSINESESSYVSLGSSLQNDIPTKMISLPNNQYAAIGFSSQEGFYRDGFVLLLNEHGEVEQSYVEYGGLGGKESEYFDILYNEDKNSLDVIGNSYIYARDELAFYSFDSDVVVKKVLLSDFTSVSQTEIKGKGSGKMQVKWLAEDSEKNIYLAGFKQLGFAAAGCSACISFNTPYLYKFSPEGTLIWKDLHDPTNQFYQTPPAFLSIDSRDHVWMLTEEYNVTGSLAKLINYEPGGNISWIYEINENGYMIDFYVDLHSRGWILHSNNNQIYLDLVDQNGDLLSTATVGSDDKTNFQLLIDEDINDPFALLMYTEFIEDAHHVLQIKDERIIWQSSIPIEDTSPLFSVAADYVPERKELSIVDNEKIVVIDAVMGTTKLNFPHNLEVYKFETGDQEYLVSLKSKDSYKVITSERLVKYSMSGEQESDIKLPIENGYHFIKNDDSFLMAQGNGKMLYSDFNLDQYEIIESPKCYEVDGLDYLNYRTSNSIYNAGSNLFIGDNSIGILGQLYRGSLVGNPIRQYDAYVPLAVTFEVDISTNTIDDIEEAHSAISVYPNPTKGTIITIDNLSELPGAKNIVIYNFIGESIHETVIPSGKSKIGIKLPQSILQQSGLYVMRISNESTYVIEQFVVTK